LQSITLLGLSSFGSLWKCTNVFQAGKASMESAGVVAADITAYLATNGTLTGTDAKN
jgi:hypothetical protein